MRFSFVTEPATFVERPNRYVVIARTQSGEHVRAHCPDPGRLRELLVQGARVHLSSAHQAGRRTTHELRFVEHPEVGTLISLDSRLANALFREALDERRFSPFDTWTDCRAEVAAPVARGPIRSRIDFLLTGVSPARLWIEVKSATLVEDRCAYFPDAVTERGRRHLAELTEMQLAGERCAVCFVVQRPDADLLRPHGERDPAFAGALAEAQSAGVLLRAFTADIALTHASIIGPIPVVTERKDSRR